MRDGAPSSPGGGHGGSRPEASAGSERVRKPPSPGVRRAMPRAAAGATGDGGGVTGGAGEGIACDGAGTGGWRAEDRRGA